MTPHTSSYDRELIFTFAEVAQIALSESESTFPIILDLCAQLTQADYGSIFIFDKDSQALKAIAIKKKGTTKPRIKMEIPISSGIAGFSARARLSYRSDDVELDPHYTALLSTKTRSVAAIPLIYAHDLIGVLNLESAKVANFTEEKMRVLELLSSIISAALRQSESRRKDSETAETQSELMKPIAFALMPFRDPYNKYYGAIIKPAAEEAGMRSLRADEIFGPTEIVKDVWKAINDAEIIVAELTTRNPNVMYELGLCHAIGKPVIMLSQNIDDIPFDLKSLRCILYDTVEPNWADKLRNDIRQSIIATMSGKVEEDRNFLQSKHTKNKRGLSPS